MKSEAQYTARVLQAVMGGFLLLAPALATALTPTPAAAQGPEMTFEYGAGDDRNNTEPSSEPDDPTEPDEGAGPDAPRLEDPTEPGASHRTPEPVVSAQQHFEWASAMYDNGDYSQALQEFRLSYVQSQRSELLYNISLCYQRTRQYSEAAVYLERYLLEVIVIDNRASLELRLHRLKESSTPTSQEPESGGASTLTWVGVTVAGAGLVTFGVAGSLALLEGGRLTDAPCSASQTCDAGTLWTRAVIADIGLGVTLVGAALAVIGFVLSGDTEPPEDEQVDTDPSDPDAQPETNALQLLTAAPWVSNEGVGLVLVGEF